MSIHDEEMRHLLTLARLELGAAETAALKDDLNAILAYFEQLESLDTDGVEELVRPVPTENVFRPDAARPGLSQAAVLALGVESQDGFFKVPRTVDEE